MLLHEPFLDECPPKVIQELSVAVYTDWQEYILKSSAYSLPFFHSGNGKSPDEIKLDIISSVHNRILNKPGVEVVGILRYSDFVSCVKIALEKAEPCISLVANERFYATVARSLMNFFSLCDVASYIAKKNFVLVHQSSLTSIYTLDVYNNYISNCQVQNINRFKSRVKEYENFCHVMMDLRSARSMLEDEKIKTLETQIRSLRSISLEQSDYKW